MGGNQNDRDVKFGELTRFKNSEVYNVAFIISKLRTLGTDKAW